MDSQQNTEKYQWVRCEYGAGTYYYIRLDTKETTWDAPNEPFWLWDAEKQRHHSLQFPDQESRKLPLQHQLIGSAPS